MKSIPPVSLSVAVLRGAGPASLDDDRRQWSMLITGGIIVKF